MLQEGLIRCQLLGHVLDIVGRVAVPGAGTRRWRLLTVGRQRSGGEGVARRWSWDVVVGLVTARWGAGGGVGLLTDDSQLLGLGC